MNSDSILSGVQQYYSEKIEMHGPTARGVDWNSSESHRLRFVQLVKIFNDRAQVSINDYGCGYGALADYLQDEGYTFDYCGFDISARMISKAKELHAAMNGVAFVCDEGGLQKADYTVASGIFNVRLQTSETEWKSYIVRTLETIDEISRKGFAFNALTKYSDPNLTRRDLYYADPLFFFDFCKTRFSRLVSLIHDYPLYEFTILVRKE